MSGQHRTDPRAWENVGVEYLRGSSAAACLLELRARVEALEAAQHAHADVSRLSDAEREQIYAELAKPAAVTRLHSYKVGKAEPIDDWGLGHTLVNPTPTPEARPGGLVERVADVFLTKTFTADDPVGARAVLREVAQTLRASFFEHAAELLEQEADRG